MADTLESTGNYLPKDIRITAQPDAVDKDKFKVVTTGLKIVKLMYFNFNMFLKMEKQANGLQVILY